MKAGVDLRSLYALGAIQAAAGRVCDASVVISLCRPAMTIGS